MSRRSRIVRPVPSYLTVIPADDQATFWGFDRTKCVQVAMMGISLFGIKIQVDWKVFGKETGPLSMVSNTLATASRKLNF